jgi:hypothetical protein
MRKQYINRTATFEMKLTGRTAGIPNGISKKVRMLDKLKIKPVTDYIQNDKRKWKEHVKEMDTVESRNKFYVINQENKDQSDVQ